MGESVGIVALLDCLAWSQITASKSDRARIIDGVKSIRKILDKLTTGGDWLVDGVHLTAAQRPVVHYISDSVLLAFPEISFEDDPNNQLRETYNLVQTLHFTAYAVIFGYRCRIPLLYRGCLTRGDFYLEDQIFIGSAVDSAAHQYERSIAPIVWLTPALVPLVGLRRSLSSDAPLSIDRLVTRYPVLFHGGGRVECYCINPFVYNNKGKGPSLSLEEAKAAVNSLMSSDDLSREEKRQETIKFLDHCHRHIEQFGS